MIYWIYWIGFLLKMKLCNLEECNNECDNHRYNYCRGHFQLLLKYRTIISINPKNEIKCIYCNKGLRHFPVRQEWSYRDYHPGCEKRKKNKVSSVREDRRRMRTARAASLNNS